MDFIDWCDSVLRKLVETSNLSALDQAYGIEELALAQALFGDAFQSNYFGAIFTALRELEQNGFANALGENWEVTEAGRRHAKDVRPFWQNICATQLNLSEHKELLQVINRVSQQSAPNRAWLEYVDYNTLSSKLAWAQDWGQFRAVVQRLLDLGFVAGELYSGESDLRATYRGLIWDTRCVRSKVFISYRRAVSEAYALLIAEKLAPYGMTVFVDTLTVEGAEPFPDRLLQAIESCDVFVCLLAPSTLESEWVQREIQHAHALSKPLIPVFQPDYTPPDTGSLPPYIADLVRFEGVKINSGYVMESLEKLARIIEQTWYRSF